MKKRKECIFEERRLPKSLSTHLVAFLAKDVLKVKLGVEVLQDVNKNVAFLANMD